MQCMPYGKLCKVAEDDWVWIQVVDDDPGKLKMREAAVLQPDMSSYLDKYPHCRDLMVKIRSMPNNDNKTPAGVLNEYATKLNLEVGVCGKMVDHQCLITSINAWHACAAAI